MILMKLIHEMENRPDFGEKPSYDPESEIQSWLARVGALMDRVGINHGVQFRASSGVMSKYWAAAAKRVQIAVMNGIEALKLELELYQDDKIGRIYQKGQEYSFVQDLLQITSAASQEIFVADPYFDAQVFNMIFGGSDLPPESGPA
jgi:hypothetical protein